MGNTPRDLPASCMLAGGNDHAMNTSDPARLALPVLAASLFVLGLASFSVVGLVEPLSRDLAVPRGDIALLMTAFALTYALMAPVLQMIIGGWDRRLLVIIGLLSIAAGSFLGALTSSFSVLLISRVAMGVGSALIGPMSAAAGAALVPAERQAAALGLVFGGMTIASVMGVPLASWLGAILGWRWVFALIGLAALVIAMLLVATMPAGSRGVRATPGALAGLLRDRVFRPAVSVTFFQMSGQFTTYSLVGPFVIAVYAIDPAYVPACLFAGGAGGVIGNIISPRLVGLIGTDRTILASLSANVAAFLIFLFVPLPTPMVYAALLFWSAAGLSLFAPQQGRLLTLAPGAGNLALALNSSAIYFGMACGSGLASIVYARWGAPALPWVSLAIMLVALGVFQLSRLRHRDALLREGAAIREAA